MKITDLDFYPVEVPRTSPLTPLRRMLLRVATSDGVEGWGESSAIWPVEQLADRRAALLPMVTGRGVFDTAELERVEGIRPLSLAAALNMAVWDAAARTLGQPLCHLWGGLYRRQIPVSADLSVDDPQRVVARARELSEQGYHMLTLPIHGDVSQVIAKVRAVSDAVSERTELRVDAEGQLTCQQAEELCAGLEAVDVQFLIDPVAADFAETARLGRRTSTTLAVCRGIQSARDVMAIVRAGAAKHVILALEAVGGISSVRGCVAVAEAADLTTLLDVRDCLGPATAAMGQLAAATPALKSANRAAYDELQDDVLTEPLELVDGMLTVPQGPGLGVEVDRGKLEQFAVS